MHDQSKAINEAIALAFQQLAGKGKKWTAVDLTIRTLEELGRREIPIHRTTISEVLASMVRDGLLLNQESDMLFLRFGEMKPAFEPDLFDAFDEAAAERTVNRAFEEPTP